MLSNPIPCASKKVEAMTDDMLDECKHVLLVQNVALGIDEQKNLIAEIDRLRKEAGDAAKDHEAIMKGWRQAISREEQMQTRNVKLRAWVAKLEKAGRPVADALDSYMDHEHAWSTFDYECSENLFNTAKDFVKVLEKEGGA